MKTVAKYIALLLITTLKWNTLVIWTRIVGVKTKHSRQFDRLKIVGDHYSEMIDVSIKNRDH